jgi:flagellar basal body-associated protein FliL
MARMGFRPLPLYLAFCLVLAAILAAPQAFAAEDSKDAKNQKAPEHKITQSASYTGIDPIYVTMMEDDHPIGMLTVEIGIDVPDEALRDVVNRSLPVLRDAYLRNLMSFSSTTVRADFQPDVAIIAGRLQAVTDHALGKKGAKVLLEQVVMRVTN